MLTNDCWQAQLVLYSRNNDQPASEESIRSLMLYVDVAKPLYLCVEMTAWEHNVTVWQQKDGNYKQYCYQLYWNAKYIMKESWRCQSIASPW